MIMRAFFTALTLLSTVAICGAQTQVSTTGAVAGATKPSQNISAVTSPPGDIYEAWFGFGSNQPKGSWAYYGFLGTEIALNQTNLYADGLMLRLDSSAGQFGPAPGKGSFSATSMMLGYRWAVGPTQGDAGPSFITLFAGPDFLYNTLPDNFNVHGPYGGGKVGLAYQINGPVGGLDLYSLTTYSTIQNAFSAYARPMYRFDTNLRIGPEVAFYNDRFYEEARLGGVFAYYMQPLGGTLWLGGGWLKPNRVTTISDGYYGYISWSTSGR